MGKRTSRPEPQRTSRKPESEIVSALTATIARIIGGDELRLIIRYWMPDLGDIKAFHWPDNTNADADAIAFGGERGYLELGQARESPGGMEEWTPIFPTYEGLAFADINQIDYQI